LAAVGADSARTDGEPGHPDAVSAVETRAGLYQRARAAILVGLLILATTRSGRQFAEVA